MYNDNDRVGSYFGRSENKIKVFSGLTAAALRGLGLVVF
jgi:hypothetical protein